jgi:hypothetical protein
MGGSAPVRQDLFQRVGMQLNRWTVDALSARLRTARHNIESQYWLPRLDLGYIPQTSYALSASAIRIILNDIVLNERLRVVELGAGISTLYLSSVLAETVGGELVSVDHDQDWLEQVHRMLIRLGTRSTVRLVHAPLQTALDGGRPWYDRDALIEALRPGWKIDSLIVDGPRARGPSDDETRHPALPVLATSLNPEGAIVFLDDIGRAGERRILDRWTTEFPLDHWPVADFCGMGVLVTRGRLPRRSIV